MPHGGYHGTIKVGGNVVQSGGGGYNPQGNNKKSNNSIQKVNSGNARDDYRANQGYRAQQQKAFEQQQAKMNRGSIQRMANKGVINRSDFKDGAARLTGESPQDYHNFMRGLYDSNPQAMQKAFPFASGAGLGNLMNFMPGMGMIKLLAGGANKMFGNTKNKMSNARSGIMNSSIGKDFSSLPGNFFRDLQNMFGFNRSVKAPGATTATVKPEELIQAPEEEQIQQQILPNRYEQIFNFPGNENYGKRQIFSNALTGIGNNLSYEDIMNLSNTNIKRTSSGSPLGRSPSDEMFARNFTREGDPAGLGRQYNQMFKDNKLGFADGGYMSSFPNQNMGTQSLTASDNIDDRIMKNLQFEKMAPGMMGYNEGGEVKDDAFERLKSFNDTMHG